MEDNTEMYKSDYEPIKDLPLTHTIPALLEWKGVSPYKVEELTEGAIKQATIHRICAGKTQNPKRPVVEKIAHFFGVTFTQIYEIDEIIKITTGSLPLRTVSERKATYSTLKPAEKRLFDVMKAISQKGDVHLRRATRILEAYLQE